MALARWQATIVDNKGNVQANAQIEVLREAAGQPPADCYSDRAGTTPLGSTFQADENGFVAFHAEGGAYQITATKGSFSRVWRYVPIGLGAESDLQIVTPKGAWDTDTLYGLGDLVTHGTGLLFISLVGVNQGNEPDDGSPPGDTEFWMFAGEFSAGPPGPQGPQGEQGEQGPQGDPGGGLADVVDDTTPQLGGDLDCNGKNIGFDDGTGINDDAGNEQIVFHKTASAVNQVGITNAASGNAPAIKAEGGGTNIDLTIDGKGTGVPKTANGDPYLAGGTVLVGHWPARSLVTPSTSSDAAGTLATAESSSNKVNDEYIPFVNGSAKYMGFSFRAPKMLNEGATFVAEIEWMEASGATAHVCRWQVEMQAQGDGDTIDSAWGTAVAVDDTGSSGTRRFAVTGAVTPAGTWAVGDKIHVRVARLGAHTNDTLDVDARLIGVTLFATINKRNEA